MKKIIIGTLVASIIYFAYQSIMWAGGFHKDFASYTPNQDSIVSGLDKNISGDGLYIIPWPDPAAPDQEKAHEELMTRNLGKPWAMIFFHKSMENMGTSMMITGFIYTLIACLITVLVLYFGNFSSFGSRFWVSMAFSVFTLSQGVLDNMNWWDYPWSFVKPEVIDLTLGWALTSLWIAKYVKRA